MIERLKLFNPEEELVALAVGLGARAIPEWTSIEEGIARNVPTPPSPSVAGMRKAIEQGQDPLGDAFCQYFSNDERRPLGATYTPHAIIEAMLAWSSERAAPVRVIDPGAGSARFLVAAGRRFPRAELIAIEVDPLAAILARGHLAAAGLSDRSRVILQDYRAVDLPRVDGQTLFLGNPPYVRHHLIQPQWKQWLTETALRYGCTASQLAGLHVHFFLATAEHAKEGDVGILITASEWLDVNYGRVVRQLLLGTLGADNIQVVEPNADPFPGTQATAVITGFTVGSKPEVIGLRRVEAIEELGVLQPDRYVHRQRLEEEDRWSALTRANIEPREGFVELGELCRVHRGAVTGANRIWVSVQNDYELPGEVLFRSITRARELFATNGVLNDSSGLRRVIDLPVDLDVFDTSDRRRIDMFLKYARAHGADSGFVARNRKAWWSVGLRKPAPILATYMARRPPKFVRNVADARHINIAHGLYPRTQLSEYQLTNLAAFLSTSVSLHDGRTYAGGLTKFEPREMERLLVPQPDLLSDSAILSELL